MVLVVDYYLAITFHTNEITQPQMNNNYSHVAINSLLSHRK
jgi:hypothetical protein